MYFFINDKTAILWFISDLASTVVTAGDEVLSLGLRTDGTDHVLVSLNSRRIMALGKIAKYRE